jgi:hypothetical protein
LFLPPLQGEDGEDGLTVPGQAGANVVTAQAPPSIPPVDGEDGQDAGAGGAGLPAFCMNPDSCRATNANNQSITTGTPTALALDTDTWDSNALHPTGAGNTKFTVVNPGKYLVTGFATWAANATGVRNIAVRKNGTGNFGPCQIPVNSGTLTTTIVATDIVDLAATDYMELVVTQSSGGNLNVTSCAMAMVQLTPY